MRNLWDRVVSCYINRVVKKPHRAFKECFGKDFDTFVKYIERQNIRIADRHIRAQTALVPLNHVDFIGRFENFEDDLKHVLNVLGMNDVEIPHKNPSFHEHYSTYYTEETKNIIARIYEDDINTFGYQFETE